MDVPTGIEEFEGLDLTGKFWASDGGDDFLGVFFGWVETILLFESF